MRRISAILGLMVLTAAAAVLPLRARPAAALEFWCWDDPVFEINGQRLAVDLGLRRSDLAMVTSVDVVLTVPANATAKVVYIDTKYFTPSVKIVKSGAAGRNGTNVDVDVLVTAGGTFDYQIKVTRPQNKGTLASNYAALSNMNETLQFTLGRR